MWQWKPNRRDFLRAIGMATGAGSLGLLGCNGNGGDGGPPPPDNGGTPPPPGNGGTPPPSGGIVVRHDVMSAAAAADLDAYRTAVAAMRNDATSVGWQAQAQIHQDHCPHSNAFFLPWHRAYLHYFEDICRQMSGKADFALPYWNWTTHPTLPPAFWQGALNDPTRTIGQNQPIPPQFVGQPVIDNILAIRDFETFGSRYVTPACQSDPFQRSFCGSGQLEAVPHNNVHVQVGGNMQTFMSPLDPIFWLHHCNVDRLWMEWNKNNANGNNPQWQDFEFVDNFVDPSGTPQSIRVNQTFSTTSLGYRYDTSPAGQESARPAQQTAVVAASESANQAQARPGQALAIPIALDEGTRGRLRGVASGAETTGAPTTVRLVLNEVPTPRSALGVRVYVGAPSAPTSTDSPHYVGTIGFFPVGGEHAGHATTFLLDVGDELAASAWGGDGPLPIHVQSVPVDDRTEAAPTEAVAPASVRIEVVEVS